MVGIGLDKGVGRTVQSAAEMSVSIVMCDGYDVGKGFHCSEPLLGTTCSVSVFKILNLITAIPVVRMSVSTTAFLALTLAVCLY